ncbi:KRAB-A domain-containing protein 2-like [Penaeus monodon]|uniref:KRAB-A domain-containing protein 2-like n=1 Tax=Penaeus monodon TaxID=6687 RepID=UPI0018A738AD|nr:KRAB-A domain-containing protein 2-like [Penaeus monodon]
MIKELHRKYANITTKALELLKSLCGDSQKKRKRSVINGIVEHPILSKEFASRGQVDLINMQSMPHFNFKWIKRAAEVAFQLVDIFLLMGTPAVLQGDNGSEFTPRVIIKLKEIWPSLTMVHGKPYHPQSQGSVERANGDNKYMLVIWFADNNSQDWSVGIKFVQFQKNAAHHLGISALHTLLCLVVKPELA